MIEKCLSVPDEVPMWALKGWAHARSLNLRGSEAHEAPWDRATLETILGIRRDAASCIQSNSSCKPIKKKISCHFCLFRAKETFLSRIKGFYAVPLVEARREWGQGQGLSLPCSFPFHPTTETHIFTEMGFSYCQRDVEKSWQCTSPWKVLQGPPTPNGKYLYGKDIVHSSKNKGNISQQHKVHAMDE